MGSRVTQRHSNRPEICCAFECGKQARLDQGLEPVADPDDRPLLCDELLQIFAQPVAEGDRPEFAGPEIVSVREAAREYQHLIVEEAVAAVPKRIDVNDLGCRPGQPEGPSNVVVPVGAGRMRNQCPRSHAPHPTCDRQAFSTAATFVSIKGSPSSPRIVITSSLPTTPTMATG